MRLWLDELESDKEEETLADEDADWDADWDEEESIPRVVVIWIKSKHLNIGRLHIVNPSRSVVSIGRSNSHACRLSGCPSA